MWFGNIKTDARCKRVNITLLWIKLKWLLLNGSVNSVFCDYCVLSEIKRLPKDSHIMCPPLIN